MYQQNLRDNEDKSKTHNPNHLKMRHSQRVVQAVVGVIQEGIARVP